MKSDNGKIMSAHSAGSAFQLLNHLTYFERMRSTLKFV